MEDGSEVCPMCGGRGFLPPLKTCANEKCGKQFRWRTDGDTPKNKRTVGIMYCSKLCASAATQRHRRQRRREEQARTSPP